MPQKNVWAIFWVAPLMAMGLSVLILKERIHWQYWLATIIGLAGIFAIYRPTVRLLTQWTIIFPLGMAFCFSLYLILTRRLRSESTVTNLFYTALVVFLPWSIGLPYFWQRLDIMAFVTMSAIGLLGFLTLYFLDKALGRAPASVLAPFLYSQPIFSMSLSSFLFGQSPGFIRLAGSIGLIGVGVFLALLRTQSDGQAQ
jgi:drug/metabolite transporter (DMT)-like permease